MYPSSTSSSSQGSLGPSSNNSSSGLTRYGSAPGSLLTTAVDSVIGPNRDFSASIGSHHQHQHHQHHQHHLGPSRYFSSETSSLTAESTCKPSNNKNSNSNNANTTSHSHSMEQQHPKGGAATTTASAGGLQRSYMLKDMNIGSGGGSGGSASTSSLVRHSSSPAGFLNQLVHGSADDGFSVSRGIGSFTSKGVSDSRGGIARLNSQLSFTRQEVLSQIAEESESVADGINIDNGQRKSTNSYTTANFGMGSWDDSNAIMFSMGPSKRSKTSSDIMNGLDGMESQFQFSMPQTTLEMATMENYLHIPQDSVPCKIRAKRGCATHPRSIAERERRTRISGKLKNLQDLVPNMDKQTSYADMLDLAVDHIKNLQSQIQNLNKDIEKCTCGCKKGT